MTVQELAKKANLDAALLPAPDIEITGVYVGDLLSWVMGKADRGNVWITIMSNVNVTAVATVADLSCILLAEGVTLDSDAEEAARTRCINVLKTDASAYEIAVKIGAILK